MADPDLELRGMEGWGWSRFTCPAVLLAFFPSVISSFIPKISEEASVSDEDQQEFDESSDEEVDVNTDGNHSQSQQDELGTSTNFLFGTRSRYGRAVRFNNRLLF